MSKMNDALLLVRAARARIAKSGSIPAPVPTQVVGAYGERVAARLLSARVVSGPGVDDHDLLLHGHRVEVKTGLKKTRGIGDLRGKVRDRVVFVELDVTDGRLCPSACSYYASAVPLGRRPTRATFRKVAEPIDPARPIRLGWPTA